MSAPVKLLGFVATAAAIFALALGVGRAVGPVDAEQPTHAGAHDTEHQNPEHKNTAQQDTVAAATPEPPGGMMVSQNGYTLDLTHSTAAAGPARPVTFVITGPDGTPVTEFERAHEKQLHLIAVRRDFVGFQHVHPTLAADGVWSIDLDLTAGTWRLFADFTAAGAEALTLGADLVVPGEVTPASAEVENRTVQVDGYEVTLDGDLVAGSPTRLTLGVSKNGVPVTDLQPYLGAYGHLVALRSGDLAYLHVHPAGAPGDGVTAPGPEIVFGSQVPSAGTYHLYLDFQHDGVVRTAAFTVTASTAAVDPTAEPTSATSETTGPGGHAGH